jgi:hypothetical protein
VPGVATGRTLADAAVGVPVRSRGRYGVGAASLAGSVLHQSARLQPYLPGPDGCSGDAGQPADRVQAEPLLAEREDTLARRNVVHVNDDLSRRIEIGPGLTYSSDRVKITEESVDPSSNRRECAPGRIRTDALWFLKPWPLPLGYRGSFETKEDGNPPCTNHTAARYARYTSTLPRIEEPRDHPRVATACRR